MAGERDGGGSARALLSLDLYCSHRFWPLSLGSPRLLEELKTRLLEPPECLPSCAQIPRMRLEIGPETLQARIEVDAIEAVAVPLPAQVNHWLPATVMVDGAAAEGLFRTPEGGFWLDLRPGRHQLILAGPLLHTQSLQLPLLLRPHRVE